MLAKSRYTGGVSGQTRRMASAQDMLSRFGGRDSETVGSARILVTKGCLENGVRGPFTLLGGLLGLRPRGAAGDKSNSCIRTCFAWVWHGGSFFFLFFSFFWHLHLLFCHIGPWRGMFSARQRRNEVLPPPDKVGFALPRFAIHSINSAHMCILWGGSCRLGTIEKKPNLGSIWMHV